MQRGAPRLRLAVAGLVTAALSMLFVPVGSANATPLAGSLRARVSGLAAVPNYVPITPARLLDTRPGGSTVDGLAVGTGPIGAASTLKLQVLGRGGVPATGVQAVVLHVTAVDQTLSTFVTAWPSDFVKPPTSTLNPTPGGPTSNLTVLGVGSSGMVSLFNFRGSVNLIVDVTGWYPTGADFHGIAPDRVLDTRSTSSPIGPGQTITLTVAGAGGVPPAGVEAVALNVTSADATADSYLTVFPAGTTRPPTSNLNITAGSVSANLAIAELSSDGKISIYNNTGSAQVIADVTGWFATGPGYTPVTPTRILDTRSTAKLQPGSTVVHVASLAGLPSSGVGAVVLNLTGLNATTATFFTVYPGGTARPGTSDLNPRPGLVSANQVFAKLGTDGNINLFNNAGAVDALIDVVGWMPSDPVVPPDVAPVAVNDSATVTEDALATAVDVLANDSDVDGGPKSIASVTQPAHGTVVITGGGTGLTYKPAADYCNTPPGTALDTFTYTLTPGSSSATVSVTVSCVDDPPVAVNDAATVSEDALATSIPVLANDTDVDGGPKSVGSVTQPTHGAVVITGGGTGLTYKPAADYCNTPPGTTLDTFTYTLTPGSSSATVSVTVDCVDDPPVAVNDAATVAQDATATAIPVLGNDTDVDGGPKSIASVTQPTHGIVVITGGGTGLTYAPTAGYCNTPPGTALDTFTYTLSPGSSSATVSMTVSCADVAPVAVNDSATVAEDALATAVDVLANDTDVDGGPKSIAAVTQPAHGTVVITGGGTGLTYKPVADYCNTPPGTTLDTFTYTLTPGSSTATVTVTVNCVDDPPVAVNDVATVAEDAAATAVDVLANDTDVDGGPKSVGSVTQPAHGAVVITGGGTGLTYKPAADYCNTPPGTGLDTFTYTLSPGSSSATVAVTVNCVNDPPTGPSTAPSYGAIANMNLSIAAGAGLLNGATDPDGATTLSVANVSATSPSGGTLTVDPATGAFDFHSPAGFTGAMTFTYKVCDDGVPLPSACSAPITATVNVAGPVIWFVDSNAATTGDGRLSSPFKTLAEAATAIGSTTGQRVFLFSGTYATGISLRSGGWLVGQPTTGSSFDTLFGLTVPSGVETRPTLGTGTVTVNGSVALNTSAFVRGIDINTTSGGLSGSAITAVNVAQTSITATIGPALDLSSVTGVVTISSVTQTAGATAVNLAGSGANVTIQGGAISGTSSKAVTISGGSGSFSSAAAIDVSTGRAVELINRTGTSLITFSGDITASGGTGISMSGGTATTTVQFLGKLALSTGTNTAFNATSGTVAATGSANTLTTTTGTALNVVNATISADGLKFQSVSAGTGASGPTNGIVLSNTGTAGGLTVTGSGTADSGGIIQRTGGAGVSLTSTRDVSLARMKIDNTTGSGVAGTGVNGFAFTNGTISNSGTVGTPDTSNIAFNTTSVGTENNLSGTVTITGNTLSNAAWHGIDILNYKDTIAPTITGNTISSSTSAASSLGSGIRLQALGSASTVASVAGGASLSNNTVTNFPSGGGILVLVGNPNAAGAAGTHGTSGSPIAIDTNVISGQSAANRMGTSAIIATVSGKGSAFFDVSNNGTLANPIGNTVGTTVLLGGNGNTTSTFSVQNNVINAQNTGTAGNGIGIGAGVSFGNTDAATVNATISGNTITNTDGNGILAVARGAAGQLNAKIQNNTVATPLSGVRPGIRVDAGNSTSTGDKVCLNISGNTSNGSGGTNGIGLRLQTGANVFAVNGMAATATPGVETYVNGLNPAGNGTLLVSATTGFTGCSLP